MALGDATVDDSSNTAAPDRPGVGRGGTAGDADGERRAIADGSSSAALTNEADAPESAGENVRLRALSPAAARERVRPGAGVGLTPNACAAAVYPVIAPILSASAS